MKSRKGILPVVRVITGPQGDHLLLVSGRLQTYGGIVVVEWGSLLKLGIILSYYDKRPEHHRRLPVYRLVLAHQQLALLLFETSKGQYALV